TGSGSTPSRRSETCSGSPASASGSSAIAPSAACARGRRAPRWSRSPPDRGREVEGPAPRSPGSSFMTKGERGASRSGTGTVLEGVGGRYRILLADGTEREAVLRGRLRLERRTGDRVVCGDRVHLSGAEEPFAIEEVLPRENELVRAGPGGRGARIVAAN